MKLKKVMMLLVIIMVGFMFMPNVHAIDIETLQDYTGGLDKQVQITKKDGKVIEAKLTADLNNPETEDGSLGYDLDVNEGENYILDLDGHKFLSYSSIAIAVHPGGTLTIKDSKGTGVIMLSERSKTTVHSPASIPGSSTVHNEGTLNIEGAKIVVGVAGHAAVYNKGILTINGGGVETQVAGAWGITNVKKATINNGNFVQGYDFSVIQNSGQMDINGGTFVGSENGNSLITNNKGTESGEVTLNIANGDFKSNLILYNGDDSSATISGGHFQNPDNVEDYLVSGLSFDDNGNVIKEEVATNEATAEKNVDTSDINLVLIISVLVLGVCGVVYTVKKKFY